VFLAQQPEVGSRSQAKAMIQGGQVQVPGQRVKPGLYLEAGQEVSFTPSEPVVADPVRAADTPPPAIKVLYQDDWLAAFDKPAGLAAHAPEDREFRGHTVASVARHLFGELPVLSGEDRPGIVHRLDRETSGVMVIARTEEAFHALKAQFKNRVAKKEYRCISYGESRFDSNFIDRAIAMDPRHPERMTVLDEGGREAETYYEVIERFHGFTHFRCLPKTGRTHQIRVHMTAIGHSLVGDKVYRSRRQQHQVLPPEAPPAERHFLHAFRLQLVHPATQAPIEFEAEVPADMQAMLRWLRDNRPLQR
jgi:23S rRNA pseudouridine1911/1915/1917 synthase